MNTQWSDSSSNTITWTSVNSDPPTVNILLVNEQVNPPINTTVVTGVSVSSGSYNVPSGTFKGNGQGFQINLVNADGTGGILAQSNQFSLSSAAVTTGQWLFSIYPSDGLVIYSSYTSRFPCHFFWSINIGKECLNRCLW